MNTVTFKVEGMHCNGCAAIVQTLLERQAGTKKAAASFKDEEALVLFDPQVVSEDQLVAVIEQGGYRVVGRNHG